jgi:L-ascorbate metabolism protein UlaG (beta-lactamase superfamily)
MTYAPIEETADIVTISHEHGDHNNLAAVKGNPEVVRASGTITAKGIEFRVVSTFHDNVQGTQRGQNRVVCFTLDGVRFCHLGDLGHRLTGEQLAQIGKVDVLFIPVGGNFTIDALLATQVADDIKPSIVIPMHYKTAKAGQNFTTVDDFLKGKQNTKRPGVSILEISREKLPAATEIVVLEHSK